MSLMVVILALAAVASSRSNTRKTATVSQEPRTYSFAYAVRDSYGRGGAQYGRRETSNGKQVSGSYIVDLPDGRRQKVEYTADHVRGFLAKVTYYGVAKHPKTYSKAVTFYKAPSQKP